MAIANFLVPEAFVAGLPADTREGAVREMVAALAAVGALAPSELDDIVRAVLRREQLGSTGIGRGIAIPHTRHASVNRLVGTCATTRDGLPFDAIDGEPVYVLFLLISPQDRPADHLRALEAVVQAVADDGFVQKLRAAPTREELARVLEQGPDGG